MVPDILEVLTQIQLTQSTSAIATPSMCSHLKFSEDSTSVACAYSACVLKKSSTTFDTLHTTPLVVHFSHAAQIMKQ